MHARARGVTLVELIVAVAIVSLLAAFVVIRVATYRRDAANSRVIALVNAIRQSVVAYEARTGSFAGLPNNVWNQTAWDQLRTALAPLATLPAWADVQNRLAVSFYATASPSGVLANHGYALGLEHPTGGTASVGYYATPIAVYRCGVPAQFATCTAVQ